MLFSLLIPRTECVVLQPHISVWVCKVILTDYPDQALVDNLVFNIEQNIELARRGAVCVMGYIWGQPVDPLLRTLLPDTTDLDAGPHTFFDLILLSDLIFNHSQVQRPVSSHGTTKTDRLYARICLFSCEKHRALLTTCELAIAPGGCVLVLYTHHRPHLAKRDMEFFDMARECGWKCEKVLTERFPVRFTRLFGSRLFVPPQRFAVVIV